ncbi:Monocarboxylate transporter 12 [Mizuhopecten yessoensis]|uniref:Monocarboxylate transporter 12 n=1 Tax=Mizuhopecten yessoensis TaxID=6573 RepID=A0A210QQJ7_MIZYE|nr:Monocarboxylate transporter 12 [Mizuhopecten yessoensis]
MHGLSFSNQNAIIGEKLIMKTACTSLYMMQSGVTKSFGILYTELLVTYDAGAGNTAWIGSLQTFLYFSMGPIANYLAVRFSFRTVVMTGGLLMSTGYLVSAFVPRIEWMFLTIGVISGFGGGLLYSPCTTLVSFYFEKRRALANGVVLSGSGIGSFLFPYFFRYAIDTFGFHGAMFLISAVVLHMCVAGALIRQPHQLAKRKRLSDDEPEVNANQTKQRLFKRKKKPIVDFSLLRIPRLAMYVISLTINIFAYSSSFVVFPAYMQSIGLEGHEITIALSMVGATEVFARSFFGWLADLKIFEKKTIMIISAAASGTSAIFIPFLRNFPAMIAYGCVLGIFPGAFWSLMAVAMLDCVKLDRLPSAMGLLTMFLSLGLVLGQPSMGWIDDATGSWDMSFRVMGVCYYISGVVLLLEPLIEKIWCSDPDEIDNHHELPKEEQIKMLTNDENDAKSSGDISDHFHNGTMLSDTSFKANASNSKVTVSNNQLEKTAPIVTLMDV